MQILLIGALIFSLLVAFFAILNPSPVTIVFLFWKLEMSLVLVIIGAMAIGALAIFVLGLAKNLSMRRKQKELEEKNKQLTQKIEELEIKIKNHEEQENQVIESNDIMKQEEQSEQ